MQTKIKNFHQPVLLDDVLRFLDLSGKKIVMDATLGLGGYTEAVLNADPNVRVLSFELDRDNMEYSKNRLKGFGLRILTVNDNFSSLDEYCTLLRFKHLDGAVFDLGLSSFQLDNGEKGFSILNDGPLDMRFDQRKELDACHVVNNYSMERLVKIFKDYGEEKSAKKIAIAIVEKRRVSPITTTGALSKLIEDIKKKEKNKKIHPATKVFQALRIEVNGELDNLFIALNAVLKRLKTGARLIVVSYHSLEDRIVKNFFRDNAREFLNLPDELTTTKLEPALKIITKKPITPSDIEIFNNPRSRSAKMRVAEKI